MSDKSGSDIIAQWVAKGETASTVEGAVGLTHRVPAGSFMMGSRFNLRETPRREVYVDEFEIGHTPVTVIQYAAFLDGGAANAKFWSEQGWAWRMGTEPGWGRRDRTQPDDWDRQKLNFQHPVTGLTFYEAEAYCHWLSANQNRLVRLPTEVEWEKAARGEDSRPWPWGEEFEPGIANTFEHNVSTVFPVGSFPRDVSPYGAVDMGGNVQEWTASEYRAAPDEAFPSYKDLRVARGGSWNDTAYGARTSYKHVYPEGYFYPFLGFRVVVAHK